MSDLVVDAHGITKIYQMGEIKVHALRGVDVQIARAEIIAIMGPSGSGKSTLMNILGCLDRPTSGEYILEGESVAELNDDGLSRIRNRKVGFVFQQFNLLARTTALENVELPLRYSGGNGMRRERAKAALEAVGLGDRIHHHPSELSGGEQQRVAIARAFVTDPVMILADEPTGQLDSRSGQEVMNILVRMNQERGTTLVLVTHDAKIAAHARRIIHLWDGMVEGSS